MMCIYNKMYVLYSSYVHSVCQPLVDTNLGDLRINAIMHGLVQDSWRFQAMLIRVVIYFHCLMYQIQNLLPSPKQYFSSILRDF